MSDIHALPLLGHDLPETPAPQAPEKVKVFKENGQWCWRHSCGFQGRWLLWGTAVYSAFSHAEKCCR